MEIENKQRYEALAEKIRLAFANVTLPPDDQINEFQYEGDRDTDKALYGQDWRTLSADVIEEHSDKLPRLTKTAFLYFLPAYMLRALDVFLDPAHYFTVDDRTVFHHSSTVGENAAYSLLPEEAESDDARLWYEARFGVFSEEQFAAIREFLDVAAENDLIMPEDMRCIGIVEQYWKGGTQLYKK